MDWTLFSSLFILQFVGHRLGDYFLQTSRQAENKSKNAKALMDHCITYSIMITILVMLVLPYKWAIVVFFLTFIEHMIVDSRIPVVWWKNFLEKTITGNKNFNIKDLPFFVIIEIDQTFHIVRMFLIALLIGYFN